MGKNVQISSELFFKLVRYFVLDTQDKGLYDEITSSLNDKIDSLSKHELYTKSKTAETEAERQKARKEYLDSIGMLDSFRW